MKLIAARFLGGNVHSCSQNFFLAPSWPTHASATVLRIISWSYSETQPCPLASCHLEEKNSCPGRSLRLAFSNLFCSCFLVLSASSSGSNWNADPNFASGGGHGRRCLKWSTPKHATDGIGSLMSCGKQGGQHVFDGTRRFQGCIGHIRHRRPFLSYPSFAPGVIHFHFSPIFWHTCNHRPLTHMVRPVALPFFLPLVPSSFFFELQLSASPAVIEPQGCWAEKYIKRTSPQFFLRALSALLCVGLVFVKASSVCKRFCV